MDCLVEVSHAHSGVLVGHATRIVRESALEDKIKRITIHRYHTRKTGTMRLESSVGAVWSLASVLGLWLIDPWRWSQTQSCQRSALRNGSLGVDCVD